MKLWKRLAAALSAAALLTPAMAYAAPNVVDPGTLPAPDDGAAMYESTLLVASEGVQGLPDDAEVLGECGEMSLVGFTEETEASGIEGASENTLFAAAAPSTGESGIPEDGTPEMEGNAFLNFTKELADSEPEKKYTVALIDTGAPSGEDGASMLGDDGKDRNGHATEMAGIIKKEHPAANILYIKALDDSGLGDASTIYAGISYAIESGADVISLSLYGRAGGGNDAIEGILNEATSKGVLVVGAAGNDGSDAGDYLPACVSGVLAAGACDTDGVRLGTSNYGDCVDYLLTAGSTSEAAARLSGLLSKHRGDLAKVHASLGMAGAPVPEKTESSTTPTGQWVDITEPAKEGTGFKAAGVTHVGGMSEVNSTKLQAWNGLRIYNRDCTVHISTNKMHRSDEHDGYFAELGGGFYRPDYADGHGRTDCGITATYYNAGKYKGQSIDLVVDLKCGDCTDIPYMTRIYAPANGARANPYDGWTYVQGCDMRVQYSFKYKDLNMTVPIDTAYFMWGSLNVYEGFMPTDANQIEFWKKDGAYPDKYNITAGTTGYHGPNNMHYKIVHGGNWIANMLTENNQGNDFADFVGGATFWKSCAFIRMHDTDHKFNFYTMPRDFWFAPKFVAPGPVADKPKKYIVKSDGTRGTSIKGYKEDTITFEIDQGVEIYKSDWTGEGIAKYSNFSFKDVLPTGLTYKSAKVLKRAEGATSGGTDVTAKGTLSHSGQTVSFKFNSSYLSSGMAYNGETYVLQIKAELEADEGARPLKNKATTKICGETQTTNEVTINQYHKVKTQVRHQKMDGTWESYSTVNTKNVDDGGSYSYTWVRDTASEPTNVYSDPSNASVSKSNVKKDHTFKIDIPRKQYTYKFHANKPSDASNNVTNMPSNITKYAENTCGNPDSTPALSGWKFKGWYDTDAATGGNAYNASEKMLSNKNFYARWERIKYYVAYNANGATNFSHETGEYTQNNTSGTMGNSTFYYDMAGTLTANAYTREGYVFTGWNTEADGTGTSYPDGYANVLNWTDVDEATITLYAQWRKLLGTETLTVISEETGNRIPGVTVRLWKLVNGIWTDTGIEKTTNAQGQVSVSGQHWFNYEWRSVSVPAGYRPMTAVNFSVYPNCNAAAGSLCSHTSGTRPSDGNASLDLAHTRILYMKHVSLRLDSKVSEIISGEEGPAFLYHVSGRDAAGVRHEYDVMVPVSRQTNTGTNLVPDMFAGTYTVTQTPVSRYNARNARAVKNASVSGINGTANLLDVPDLDYGEILFPYDIEEVGYFGSMDSVTNHVAR